MKRFSFVLASLVALIASPLHAADGDFIVVISPGNGQLPGLSLFMSGFRKTLGTNLTARVVTYSEYLNSDLMNDPDYQDEMTRWMRLKYRGKNPLALLAVDEQATALTFRIRDALWSNTPVIFIDRGDVKDSPFFGATNATGISVNADVRETLQIALELRPGTRHIAFISAGQASSPEFYEYNLKQVQELAGNRLDVINLSGLGMSELKERLANLPPQTIAFFDGTWNDTTGRLLTPRDAAEEFSGKADVPVFSSGETFIGAGIVGGLCTLNGSLGAEAALQAASVIRAGNASAVPVVHSEARGDIFDWQQLQRFHLDEKKLPPESEVRFRRVTIWETYRRLIITVAIIVLVQTFLITLLLIQRRRMRRSEEELFNSRHTLQTILDTIPQRVFWKDRNFVFMGCNKPMAQDCGFSNPEELVGKTDEQLASAPQAKLYQADDLKVMETDKPKLNFEEPKTKMDGSAGWLRTNKVPLHDKNGNVIGVLGTYEDITDLRRLEEQLRQMQKMEAFGQLAAGVAHDFNNILTVIHGNISLLQSDSLSEDERAKAFQQSLAAADRAANLTRQLLTFGRRQVMQPRDLDLNTIVANITRMLQRLIGENISLEARYETGGALIHADLPMMEQVLMNLAINSRDAMHKGGTLLVQTAAVTVDQERAHANKRARPGQFIRLTVKDTGSGIAPNHLPHIFEPFFTTKEIGKGTGLGLATVFGIVEQHHGWIEVESELNKGTTMHVFLPRAING